MIKKYWAYIIFVFALLFFIYKFTYNPNHTALKYNTFNTSAGWGYNIYVKDSLMIHQSIIPTVEGNKGFATQQDAEKVAKLLLHKINATGKLLNPITINDLDSLKIKY